MWYVCVCIISFCILVGFCLVYVPSGSVELSLRLLTALLTLPSKRESTPSQCPWDGQCGVRGGAACVAGWEALQAGDSSLRAFIILSTHTQGDITKQRDMTSKQQLLLGYPPLPLHKNKAGSPPPHHHHFTLNHLLPTLCFDKHPSALSGGRSLHVFELPLMVWAPWEAGGREAGEGGNHHPIYYYMLGGGP